MPAFQGVLSSLLLLLTCSGVLVSAVMVDVTAVEGGSIHDHTPPAGSQPQSSLLGSRVSLRGRQA